MTITEAARALDAREISSVELVRQSLLAIESLNPALNAFISVTGERAMQQARRADERRFAGEPCGPLAGIPIALKDVFATRTIRTTCGSKILAGYIPDHDAAVTERLEAAGAILMGKTGLHEFAYGITSDNPHFGAIRNPWDSTRIPGGSSGGSGAAVASGMVFAAMGSDTGGSIRLPASFCGTVGLKPTSGRVSRYGVLPLDYSLDHMGPLTRSVADAAIVLEAVAGPDVRDDSCSSAPVERYYDEEADLDLRGLRVGWPENFYHERVSPAVRESMERCSRLAAGLGAELISVRVPDIAAINAVGRVILMSEASALLEKYLDQRENLGEDLRLLVEQGCLLPATWYINAQRLRREMQREFNQLWSHIDCLLTPATPIAAPPIWAVNVTIDGVTEDTRTASTRFARAFNVLGVPAITIPCGFENERLPVGLQIVTRAFSEKLLLRVAGAFESALGYRGLIAPRTP